MLDTIKDGDRYERTFLYINDSGELVELKDTVTIHFFPESRALCIPSNFKIVADNPVKFHDRTHQGRPLRYVNMIDINERNFPLTIHGKGSFIEYIIYKPIAHG